MVMVFVLPTFRFVTLRRGHAHLLCSFLLHFRAETFCTTTTTVLYVAFSPALGNQTFPNSEAGNETFGRGPSTNGPCPINAPRAPKFPQKMPKEGGRGEGESSI